MSMQTRGGGRCAGRANRLTSTCGSGKVLMREIWFALLFLAAAAGVVPAAAQAPKAGADAAALLAVTAEDRVLGRPDAPVTIIEYASLTCPHCAHFAKDVLPKLK